tara:strand:- start:143 stop:475 length:333 start_codon:yes stop_codon:yes gene_type:complete
MRRYHSIKSTRVRNKRKSVARIVGNVDEDLIDSNNLNSEQIYLGSCGSKSCNGCNWLKFEKEDDRKKKRRFGKKTSKNDLEQYWHEQQNKDDNRFLEVIYDNEWKVVELW